MRKYCSNEQQVYLLALFATYILKHHLNMRATNCSSISLVSGCFGPKMSQTIYLGSTNPQPRKQRERWSSCVLPFLQKKSRRFQCSVSHQECKLPVCQHCRKLGNHSAGVWVEGKRVEPAGQLCRVLGIENRQPPKSKVEARVFQEL